MSTHIVNIKANTSHVVHLERQSTIKITNDKIKSSTAQQHFYQKKKQSKSSDSSFDTKVPIVMIPKKTFAPASAPTTPQQQRRTILPVKARRVERRKEIVSIKLELSAISSESDDSISSSSSSSSNSRRKKNNSLVVPIVHNKRNEQQQQQQQQQQKLRRRASSVDIRSSVYAGPTFNNSPAPSTLPIPAFSPPSSTIKTNIVSIELERQKLSRHSKDLMNILSPQPLKNDFDLDLSEIQRGLRSMLKI